MCEAAVSFIDPRIDAASGLFRVKLLLDNPNHDIKAGMRGEADFTKVEPSRRRRRILTYRHGRRIPAAIAGRKHRGPAAAART